MENRIWLSMIGLVFMQMTGTINIIYSVSLYNMREHTFILI